MQISQLSNPFLPPGHLVDVGSFRLHQYTLGSGNPTVLLEAGGQGWSLDWRLVQPQVAQFTQVCAYDRAGLGWSDPGPEPRHVQRMVDELGVLLERSDILGPLVLVAASHGAYVARLFTHQYPSEVAGMVLVDAWHETLSERMPPAWQKLEKRRTNNLKRQHTLARMGLLNRIARLFGENATLTQIQDLPGYIQAMYYKPQYFATLLAEWTTRTVSEAQVKPCGLLGDIPLIVIRQESPGQFSQLTDDQATQAGRVWREMQDELVGLSSNSKLVLVEQSDHNIPLNQPHVVVDAIREVVEAIRSAAGYPRETVPD